MNGVLNKRYDLNGLEISRLVKFAIMAKFVPMGNFRGGPGARCLSVLLVLHFFGYPLYFFKARYGMHLGPLKRMVATYRNR
jgi:hypothetical protein